MSPAPRVSVSLPVLVLGVRPGIVLEKSEASLERIRESARLSQSDCSGAEFLRAALRGDAVDGGASDSAAAHERGGPAGMASSGDSVTEPEFASAGDAAREPDAASGAIPAREPDARVAQR